MENQGNFLNNQNPYQMGNLKKINEKRKLIDDLTLFLNSNKNLINDPVNKDKFSAFTLEEFRNKYMKRSNKNFEF